MDESSKRWGIFRISICIVLLLLLVTPVQKFILDHLGIAVFALPVWAVIEVKTTFFPGKKEPKE